MARAAGGAIQMRMQLPGEVRPTLHDVTPVEELVLTDPSPTDDCRACPQEASAGISTASNQSSRAGSTSEGDKFRAFLKRRTPVTKSDKLSVSKRDMDRLTKAFAEVDVDDSGFITKSELRSFLEMRFPPTNGDVLAQVVDQAMARADTNGDGVLAYKEFMQLLEVQEPRLMPWWPTLVRLALMILFFALAPLVYSSAGGMNWTFWDSLYFATVTVTTVGYGDLTPKGDGLIVFTLFYIIFGLLVVAGILDDVISRILQDYEDRIKRLGKQSYQEKPTKHKSGFHVFDGTTWLMMRRISSAALLFILPVSVGTVFFALNEDWPWLHALYHSVVTCTTIGYGDMKLQHQSSRIFSIFFIFVGFASVGAAIGQISSLKVELVVERRRSQILASTLSMDMIADLDRNGDGVDKCEYVCAMLLQLNKVTEEDLTPLLQKFDELDADGSGMLTKADLECAAKDKARGRLAFEERSGGHDQPTPAEV